MRAERRELREFLRTLTPEQRRQPSLCAGWNIDDVVGHLVAWDELLIYRTRAEHRRAVLRFLWLYASSFASMRRLNERLRRRVRARSSEELVDSFGRDDGPDRKWLFDGSNPGGHLAEYVIHHEDVRRPFGVQRELPAARLVAALAGARQLPGVRGAAWWRRSGHRWEATDVDWHAGRGAVVRAPGLTILMALAGRDELPDQ
jgi:uncharacterized protein (TIGR03083 family)